jgi:hypothetical protein
MSKGFEWINQSRNRLINDYSLIQLPSTARISGSFIKRSLIAFIRFILISHSSIATKLFQLSHRHEMIRLFLTLLCLLVALDSVRPAVAMDDDPIIINPSSGLPPIVTGISAVGCEQHSSTQVINCARPLTLTLSGSGFMTGLEYSPYPSNYLTVTILPGNSQTSYYCWVTVNDFNTDTQIACICKILDLVAFKKVY